MFIYFKSHALGLFLFFTYEASIEVSPIIRSFIRIKSAREGFPLTVGEVAFGDEQHSAPDTVICTEEIPSQTWWNKFEVRIVNEWSFTCLITKPLQPLVPQEKQRIAWFNGSLLTHIETRIYRNAFDEWSSGYGGELYLHTEPFTIPRQIKRTKTKRKLTSETSSRRSPVKGNDAGTGRLRGGGSGGTGREQGWKKDPVIKLHAR